MFLTHIFWFVFKTTNNPKLMYKLKGIQRYEKFKTEPSRWHGFTCWTTFFEVLLPEIFFLLFWRELCGCPLSLSWIGVNKEESEGQMVSTSTTIREWGPDGEGQHHHQSKGLRRLAAFALQPHYKIWGKGLETNFVTVLRTKQKII